MGTMARESDEEVDGRRRDSVGFKYFRILLGMGFTISGIGQLLMAPLAEFVQGNCHLFVLQSLIAIPLSWIIKPRLDGKLLLGSTMLAIPETIVLFFGLPINEDNSGCANHSLTIKWDTNK